MGSQAGHQAPAVLFCNATYGHAHLIGSMPEHAHLIGSLLRHAHLIGSLPRHKPPYLLLDSR